MKKAKQQAAGEEVGVENVQNTFKNSSSSFFFFFFLKKSKKIGRKKLKETA